MSIKKYSELVKATSDRKDNRINNPRYKETLASLEAATINNDIAAIRRLMKELLSI